MDRSIFANLDFSVIIYAAICAAVMSLIMTARARAKQKALSLPPASWEAIIPDTGIGTVTGTLLAIGVPFAFAWARNFTAVSVLACVGGVIGPKLWDMVQADGAGIFKTWLASVIPMLGKAMVNFGQTKTEDPSKQDNDKGGTT